MTTTSSSSSGIAVPVVASQTFVDQGKLTNDVLSKLSSMGKSTVSVFMEYINEMGKPVPPATDKAVRLQVGLYRAIIACINRNDKDFNATWTELLNLVDQNNSGVFCETKIFSYMPFITLDEEKRRSFRMILVFLKQTANPKDRPFVMRQMDFNHVFKGEITEEGRNRLINFYSRYMPS